MIEPADTRERIAMGLDYAWPTGERVTPTGTLYLSPNPPIPAAPRRRMHRP